MSKANPIEASEIPAHMLESPTSKAQKKAFAKVKRAAAKEEKADEKADEKKSSRKKQSEA